MYETPKDLETRNPSESPAKPVHSGARRVLVVEDEPLFALRLELLLRKLGYQVIGPALSLKEALSLAHEPMDAALLDVNLAGRQVFPVADALASSAVPFVFLTAYDRSAIPAIYQQIPLVSKPLLLADLTRALSAVFA